MALGRADLSGGTMARMASRLREMLASDDMFIAPGVWNPLVAKLAENTGFDLLYMTGGGTAQMQFGLPDIGLLTMTEMVNNAAAITSAVNVPLITDADTGYGNALNVHRTVKEFERAGVAGLHLEDQVTPKKCGHLTGKQLVSKEEHAEKITAAREARKDGDLVIIARTDALIVEGLEGALIRGRAYIDAGAEVLFVEGPRSLEDLHTISEHLSDVPLLYNMSASGMSPFLSLDELGNYKGYRIMIVPSLVLEVSLMAAKRALTEMRDTSSPTSIQGIGLSWRERQELVGLPTYQELERRYGFPDDSRTGFQQHGAHFSL